MYSPTLDEGIQGANGLCDGDRMQESPMKGSYGGLRGHKLKSCAGVLYGIFIIRLIK